MKKLRQILIATLSLAGISIAIAVTQASCEKAKAGGNTQTISNDDTKILFSTHTDGVANTTKLWLLSLSDTTKKIEIPILENGIQLRVPAWSGGIYNAKFTPNGTKIIFQVTSSDDITSSIYIVPAEGGECTLLIRNKDSKNLNYFLDIK